MKKLIIILLVVVCLASLWSCDNKNTNDQEPVETEPLSAYEQLNDKEKLLYEALIIWTTKFERMDARVLAVGYMTMESKKVQIQIQYSYKDSTIDTPFFMGLSETSTEITEQKGVSSYHPGNEVYHDKNGNVDCGNINRALKEYWDKYYEDMGLN